MPPFWMRCPPCDGDRNATLQHASAPQSITRNSTLIHATHTKNQTVLFQLTVKRGKLIVRRDHEALVAPRRATHLA